MEGRKRSERIALGTWLVLITGSALTALGGFGGGVLWIDGSRLHGSAAFSALALSLLLSWTVTAWLGYYAAKLLTHSVGKDLQDIIAWVDSIQLGQGQFLAVTDSAEWGALAYSLNEMASRLKEASEEREAFLASVAHEIKTPLTVLQGNLEGLASGVLDPTPIRWATLEQEVQRLIRLIDQLLLIERVNRHLVPLHTSVYRLADQLASLTLRFDPLAIARHIRLTWDSPEVPVCWDRDRIDQILTNLLQNALRQVAEGGRIAVSALAEADAVALCVEDDGPGLPPRALGQVADPFIKDPRSPGLGLGLAVVAAFAKAHGGSMQMGRSAMGGAKVCVTLPYSPDGLMSPTSDPD